MLLQDGREVGFGNIILKGTVAEHHRAVSGRRKLVMPPGNSKGQRLDLRRRYAVPELDGFQVLEDFLVE